MRDLHALPKFADSLSYLYAEHCIVEKKQEAVELFDQEGATLVPAAALAVLLLGPGTRITHAAVKTLADNGCTIVWVGEDGTRCYANGGGETRRAHHLLQQARLASTPHLRLEVCKRMYIQRFKEALDPELTIQQLRGMEGARVRSAYARLSLLHGVPWQGRSYDRASWGHSNAINRAISAANALLNGLCHAAIVSGGYSPGLGFVHTGKQLSFVYDVADLYKIDFTVPIAFEIVGKSSERVEPRVREACRQAFKERKLLQCILPDIQRLLDIPDSVLNADVQVDSDPAAPVPLWDPPEDEAVGPLPAVVDDKASDPLPTAVDDPVSAPLPAVSDAKPLEPLSVSPDEKALQARRKRAEIGLKNGWIVSQVDADTWHVTTRPNSPGYTIRQVEERLLCDCPDFAKTGLGACKHTFAVVLSQADQSVSSEEKD